MRLKPALLVLLFSLGFMVTQAQTLTLKGRLLDKDSKTPISGATVTLIAQKDSLNPKTVLTNAKGEFAFTGLVVDKYRLLTSMLDYDVVSQVINLQASNKEPLVFNLSKQPKNLAEVSVKAKKPVVQQKGDTLEFNASELKVNPDANAEDMIKKLPGVTIDKDGNVTSGGDQIRKVTVDGRDFFGDDATAALRNLPASVIDKIQVFDKLSDQAQFTGFDDGNSIKSINIVTKQGMRNGQFGRVYAGAGTQGTYNAGGNVSLFKNNLRLTFVGLTNNVNQQNFASQDLLGVTSSGGGGGRGGGRGGGGNFGGGGFGGNNNNFTVGQQNGISKTNSFGLNFSDIWGKKKKAEISGSYFFNNSNTSNDQLSNTENFQLSGKNQYYNENAVSSSKNFNHRINFRLNYKINDKNSIIITPNLSFQDNTAIKDISGYNTYSPTDSISRSINNSDSKNFGYNFSNNILFRHSFAKRGRTLSVNFNTTLNKRDGDTYIYNINDYYTPGGVSSDSLQQYTGLITSGYQLGANVSYTEPIGKKGQLQISYTPSYAKNKSDQEVYQYDHVGGKYTLFDDSLSNKFDNVTIKHNTGVTYRLGDRDNMFSVGLSYQYTELTSDRTYPSPVRVSKNFNNVLPNLMWTKKFNARNSIRVFYRANTNTPSVTQLQDVYNNNNPLFVTAGNPNLKQQVGNVLSARYTYTNTAKSKSLFFNVFLQQNSNYITNATYTATKDSVLNSSVTLYKGSQLSKPVNVDGYWSLRSFITYSMPLKFMKSNLSINGGFTYGNTPGLINNIRNNSKSYVYNAGVVLASNISEYVDFNINYSVNFNNVTNSIQPSLDNKYVQQSAGAQLNLLSKKGWFIQNDISNQSYSGLSGGFNQRYWLWNAGIGKKFLKKQQAELKLTVFDLLKQNQSITRTATDSYIQDVQNQVLRQYFMLTFTYNLKNFGTAKPGNNSGFERERMGGSGGGFRPF
ncbi:MAG TPA: outer membrane beta-barrel protein [Ferruginibacter sp.]|nr:outer membrane beta-barrel protein [Ferruginibacter sp.]